MSEEAPATQSSSSNLTFTSVMGAAALPTPGGGTGGPITTVYGKRAPDVWATKGWALDEAAKPNIASETITVETEKVKNTTLNNAEATINKNPKTEDTWEPKGWVVEAGSGPATGATAGTPGTWTPPGSTPPATVAQATGITASPTTAWTTGQYVQGSTAGAPGEMCWTGTGWVGGKAP